MRIFVQTASLQHIREMHDAGVLDGVVLSHTDLAHDEPAITMRDRMLEIEQMLAIPVCVTVGAVTGSDIYREAREVARAADRIIVQIPFVEDAVRPIRKLVADGVQVCATYVYTGAQAYLAAKIGARMVMTNLAELQASGYAGAERVAEMRAVIDRADLECDLIVAGAETSQQFAEAILAGADTVCLTPRTIHTLMINALTDRGVDKFLGDISKRHKPRSV